MRTGLPTTVLTLVGTLLAFWGFELGEALPNNVGLLIGGAGIIASILAILQQSYEQMPYRLDVRQDMWKLAKNNEFVLKIPGVVHGKGDSPAISFIDKDRRYYCEFSVATNVRIDGTIFLRSFQAIEGKIVIR